MAGKSAVLAIKIVSDASGAARGFDKASSKVQKFEAGLDRASGAAAGALAAVGAIATKAYQDAAALQQSSGAIESVYGKHSAAITQQAKAAADAVGLSQNAYQELSSVVGSQLKGMGYAGKKLTDQNQALIQTGADLAATFGGSTSDAVSALSSLMRGERDPIERYGIAISQAAVDAKAAAMGLDEDASPAVKRAAQAQATLALVAEQSAGAQGAFAREANTASGQTERAKAAFENASAQLGEVLLPVVTLGAQKLSALAAMMVRNKDVVLPLIGVVAGLAAGVLAVNAAVKVVKAAQIAWNAVMVVSAVVQKALNGAMRANPIGMVVTAIGLLAAGVAYAYENFESFRNAIDWAWDKLKDFWNWLSSTAVGEFVGQVFGSGATLPVTVTPTAGGGLAGVFGATAGPAPVGVYGASMTALSGGGSTAGQGSPVSSTTVNITVQGAIDPQSTARQIRKLLDGEATLTGRSMTLVTR